MDKVNAVFEDIFKQNTWGSTESVSGPGSKLEYTKNIRKVLPELVERFKINSMIDVPCGDLNWFSEINFKKKINYYGFDIVDEIIQNNKYNYKNRRNFHFEKKDAIKDKLPKVDLIFCRDLIIHFPNDAVIELLRNFIKSGSKYLLITQHILTNNSNFQNADIQFGQFTYRNLTRPPFNFPLPKILIPEDWPDYRCIRTMAMYDLKELAEFLNSKGN